MGTIKQILYPPQESALDRLKRRRSHRLQRRNANTSDGSANNMYRSYSVDDFKENTRVILSPQCKNKSLRRHGYNSGIVIKSLRSTPSGAVRVKFTSLDGTKVMDINTQWIIPARRRRLPSTSSVTLNGIRRLRRRLAFETSEYEKY